MPRASTVERRAQILSGFRTVFAAAGYAGANMRAVADAAGLTPGLLHYHFPNKRAMLLGLIDTLADDLLAGVPHRAAGRIAADALIDRLLDLRHGDPIALACWVQARAEAQRDPAVAAAYRRAIDRLHAHFTTALAPLGASDAAVVGIIAAIEGYFGLAVTCPGLVPPGSAAPTVRAMLAGVLA